jgi:hypothetical protein
MKMQNNRNILAFLLISCAVFFSGCSFLSSPESTLSNFYSNIDSGNYDAAKELAIGFWKEPFFFAAENAFGKNGDNLKIESIVVEKISEENPENYRGYGNVEAAGKYRAKLRVVAELKFGPVEAKPIFNVEVEHILIKVDGAWKISSGSFPRLF